jgi:hypothetical protein
LAVRGVSLDLRGVSLDLRGVSLDLRGVSLDLRGVSLDLRGVMLELGSVILVLGSVALPLGRLVPTLGALALSRLAVGQLCFPGLVLHCLGFIARRSLKVQRPLQLQGLLDVRRPRDDVRHPLPTLPPARPACYGRGHAIRRAGLLRQYRTIKLRRDK